jgi:hypothetical protein
MKYTKKRDWPKILMRITWESFTVDGKRKLLFTGERGQSASSACDSVNF